MCVREILWKDVWSQSRLLNGGLNAFWIKVFQERGNHLSEARTILKNDLDFLATIDDRCSPAIIVGAALSGSHCRLKLPFQKVQYKPKKLALEFSFFPFPHILQLVSNMLGIYFFELAASKETGIGQGPLVEIIFIQIL